MAKNYGLTEKKKWVVIGGSYPGALSAWFRSLYPDQVYISWSSSGVINAIQDFSDFDSDIYQATVKSGDWCPSAISSATEYVDHVLKSN